MVKSKSGVAELPELSLTTPEVRATPTLRLRSGFRVEARYRRAVECSESIWFTEFCAKTGVTEKSAARATKANSDTFLNIGITFFLAVLNVASLQAGRKATGGPNKEGEE